VSAHWTTRWLGLRYTDDFDCADFVERVLAVEFRRPFRFPHRRPAAAQKAPYAGAAEALRRQSEPCCAPPKCLAARDGDVCILDAACGAGPRVLHAGIYVAVGPGLSQPQAPAVLHCCGAVGQSVLTALSRLMTPASRYRLLSINRLS